MGANWRPIRGRDWVTNPMGSFGDLFEGGGVKTSERQKLGGNLMASQERLVPLSLVQ